MRVGGDKVKRCIFYIHIFFDFLPVLEYNMRNRTEQNRTEQNRIDVLGLGVKPYFQKSDTSVGAFHSERTTIKQINLGLKDNKFYLPSAYIQEV